MRENSLQYIVGVLKGETPQTEPEWFETLGFLQCHRTAGLFYSRAKKAGLTLPAKAEKLLSDVHAAQVRRNEFMRKWIEDISEELTAEKLEHVFLKGSVLSNAMGGHGGAFYGPGERASNDIDVLVRPDEVTALSRVLKEMGFVQGTYSPERHEVIPFSRMEIVGRKMNRGETAPFLRAVSCSEVPFIEVDVNFSLGYAPGDGEELLAEMLESRQRYRGLVSLYAAQEELFFLHLILHQYKESELYFMVQKGKDLDLYKLADIYYFWHGGVLDEERLRQIAFAYEIEKKVGTVLGQTARVFGDKEMLAAAEEYGEENPDVLDFAAKKRYLRTAGERDRIACFDGKKFLRAVENDG